MSDKFERGQRPKTFLRVAVDNTAGPVHTRKALLDAQHAALIEIITDRRAEARSGGQYLNPGIQASCALHKL